MEIHVLAQGKNDLPVMDVKGPLIDVSQNEVLTFVVMEKGMGSGEPSVMIKKELEEWEDVDGS